MASTDVWSAISLVSRTSRSVLSSSKGLPRSSIALTREWTSLANAAWTLVVWSWWRVSTLPPQWCCWSWNSSITLATSGPATIQRRRALGLSVRPTAPPSPLTWALFCSCAWSIAIAENTLLVFRTVKLPSLNSLAIKQHHHVHHLNNIACKNLQWNIQKLKCHISTHKTYN